MGIFAKPSGEMNPDGLNVLFLHGLEGSPEGAKALHLKDKWGAKVPRLRTEFLRELKSKYGAAEWQEIPKAELKVALDKAYHDALAALNYTKPDIVIGSSFGGALLAKMILDNKWSGNSIFIAPAIQPLLGEVALPEMRNAVWILGEMDEIVPNGPNIYHCLKTGGSLMVMEGASHRLPQLAQSGLIDNAIITVVEIKQMSSII